LLQFYASFARLFDYFLGKLFNYLQVNSVDMAPLVRHCEMCLKHPFTKKNPVAHSNMLNLSTRGFPTVSWRLNCL
jgi:hypothetical protein